MLFVGLLVAAYSAHDKIIKGGAIFNVLLPVLPLLVYFGSVWYSGNKVKRTTSRPISPPASLTMIEVEQNAKERDKEEV